MELIEINTELSDMNYEVLRERRNFFKEGKEGNLVMGKIEGMRDAAMRMLISERFGIEEIAELSGLSVEEVKELSANKTA